MVVPPPCKGHTIYKFFFEEINQFCIVVLVVNTVVIVAFVVNTVVVDVIVVVMITKCLSGPLHLHNKRSIVRVTIEGQHVPLQISF